MRFFLPLRINTHLRRDINLGKARPSEGGVVKVLVGQESGAEVARNPCEKVGIMRANSVAVPKIKVVQVTSHLAVVHPMRRVHEQATIVTSHASKARLKAEEGAEVVEVVHLLEQEHGRCERREKARRLRGTCRRGKRNSLLEGTCRRSFFLADARALFDLREGPRERRERRLGTCWRSGARS